MTAAKKEATVAAEETGVVVAAAASSNSGFGAIRQHWQRQEQVTAAETEPVVGADDNQPKRGRDSGSDSGSDSAVETVMVAEMAAAVAVAVATKSAMVVAAVVDIPLVGHAYLYHLQDCVANDEDVVRVG